MVSYTEPRRLPQIFDKKLLVLLAKFLETGFPRKVIENTINSFNKVDKKLMISQRFFNEIKTFVINLPFLNKNEHFF